MRRRTFPAVIAALLCAGGCALLPKTDGLNVEHPNGLNGVADAFSVDELDPDAFVPLLDQAFAQLKKTDQGHRYEGVTYGLSEGNALGDDWLIQSPNAWGMKAGELAVEPLRCPTCDPTLLLPRCSPDLACAVGRCATSRASITRAGAYADTFCLGHSDDLLGRIHDMIAGAQRAVDIAWLQPPADGRFLGALRNALAELAASGRRVTVRMVVGSYPPAVTEPAKYLASMVQALPAHRHHLSIYMATTRSCANDDTCDGLSWNHAKIVAVDGRRAIVGGHNMWTTDYLLDSPVHDVSMEIAGPAVRDAHRFADAIWTYVCAHSGDGASNAAYRWTGGRIIGKGCLASIRLPPAAKPPGNVKVLSIGRLGKGINRDFTSQSLIARTLFFGAARHSIRMLQQDIAFAIGGIDPIWPDAVLQRLADLLLHDDADVYIILSNPGAAGPTGQYSNGTLPATVVKHILEVSAQRSGKSHRFLVDRLCRHLHVAPLRFGPDDRWKDGKPIGMHSKVWMVDDRVFYIGSENVYPTNLQEFGYVLDDAKAAAQLRHDLWDRAWEWSQRAAVSGSEAQHCVLEGG